MILTWSLRDPAAFYKLSFYQNPSCPDSHLDYIQGKSFPESFRRSAFTSLRWFVDATAGTSTFDLQPPEPTENFLRCLWDMSPAGWERISVSPTSPRPSLSLAAFWTQHPSFSSFKHLGADSFKKNNNGSLWSSDRSSCLSRSPHLETPDLFRFSPSEMHFPRSAPPAPPPPASLLCPNASLSDQTKR